MQEGRGLKHESFLRQARIFRLLNIEALLQKVKK